MAVIPCAIRIEFAVRDGRVDESVAGGVVTLERRQPVIVGRPGLRNIASKLAKVTSRTEQTGQGALIGRVVGDWSAASARRCGVPAGSRALDVLRRHTR